MQCPFCASELGSDAIACEKCGARRVTQRTPVGVIVGWLGITTGLLSAILASPLLVLPFTEHGVSGYPWAALIVGCLIAGGCLGYSKTTLHATWVRRER